MPSIMFCHDCFHWITPRESQCTECGSHFDISEPDPDAEFINYVTGDIQRKIGLVAIDRSQYPGQGELYTTDNGILFTPQCEYENKPPFLIKKQVRKSLKFSLNLFSENENAYSSIKIENPVDQKEFYPEQVYNSVPLSKPSEFLLSHPGVFFISFEAITSIHKMFYRWRLDRSYGKSLLIKPVADRTQFHFDMQEISRSINNRKYSLNNI